MGRAPCCDKANVKKGPWSPEEDAKLKSYIEQHGTGGNWIALPQKIGLKRCGKSCRLRWLNYLRPNIKHGGFSEEEDSIICSLYISIGSRWSIIAAQLPGRTDNDIKNYWNTRLKKKLLGSNRVRKPGGGSSSKKPEDHIGNLSGIGVSDFPMTYWPEMNPVNYEHSSNRKLLMKIGGRFTSDNNAFPMMQETYAVDSSAATHLMAAPIQTNSLMAEFDPAEIDDMFGCNSAKLEGLDSFYGFGNSTMIADNVNWSEVTPLSYQPMLVPNSYQGMQPFEEAVHLGTR